MNPCQLAAFSRGWPEGGLRTGPDGLPHPVKWYPGRTSAQDLEAGTLRREDRARYSIGHSRGATNGA